MKLEEMNCVAIYESETHHDTLEMYVFKNIDKVVITMNGYVLETFKHSDFDIDTDVINALWTNDWSAVNEIGFINENDFFNECYFYLVEVEDLKKYDTLRLYAEFREINNIMELKMYLEKNKDILYKENSELYEVQIYTIGDYSEWLEMCEYAVKDHTINKLEYLHQAEQVCDIFDRFKNKVNDYIKKNDLSIEDFVNDVGVLIDSYNGMAYPLELKHLHCMISSYDLTNDQLLKVIETIDFENHKYFILTEDLEYIGFDVVYKALYYIENIVIDYIKH